MKVRTQYHISRWIFHSFYRMLIIAWAQFLILDRFFRFMIRPTLSVADYCCRQLTGAFEHRYEL